MSIKTYTFKVTAGPLAGQDYPVNKESMNLGRSSTCDIAIKDPLLSRTHCRFELRDNKLFVTDLASANETLVNGVAVDEKELFHNDLVEMGETTMKVVSDPPETNPAATTAAAAATDAALTDTAGDSGDVLIDLGFNNSNDESADEKKSFMRPLLWSAAAVLILIAGTTIILTQPNNARKKAPVKVVEKAEKLLIHYEKVEADTSNIFRYSLTLTPDGMLSAVIDDIEGDRHIQKEQQLKPDLLKELTRTVRTSGFFALDQRYIGYAANPGTLKQWRLTIALGKKAHTCFVRDRIEPETFKVLREKLETFSKNELGIWAIQFSSDKLIELATEAKAVADKKAAEMNVRHSNLYEAIKSYKEAIFYLDTINPKPDFYADLVQSTENCEKTLEKRYEDQRFKADRAINLSEWPTAATELKILREMIPERSDPRNAEAVRKLLDVEGRL